jgi:predicted GNAT family acetyltransferase
MEIIHNIDKLQFEYKEGVELAKLEYRYHQESIAFTHTEVPEGLQGKGIAAALTKTAFAFAKETDKSVMMYCSYISTYVKRHPELKEQLNKEFHK